MASMRGVLISIAVVLTACASAPAVSYPPETPGDLVELADSVFDHFVAAFPSQRDCIGDVTVIGQWELDDRALYRPASQVIEVRIPATAPHLTSSLVHELGHHLEYACDSQVEVRPEFLAAIGETDWESSGIYEEDPGELWAEAVVRHVTGQPDTRRILSVPIEAVRVVADWANR